MDEKLCRYMQNLPPEVEQGNVEYKLHLISPSEDRFEHLVTQLKWRLAEGHGEAMYEIGVTDDGELIGISDEDLKASIETLRKMGESLKAEISTVRERIVYQNTSGTEIRKVAEIMVRKSIEDDQHFLEIRVVIVGSHAAGKSTLLGVLSYGEFDNGRGKARLNLLRHRHEIESGRTSSIARQIIGFHPNGELVNVATAGIHSWEQVCEVSSKIISFLDTCGHPRYQRTTISGLTGRTPDYACLIVNANGAGISEVSREHLGIAVVFKVPIMVVITKIDIATQEQLTKTLQVLFQLLKSPGLRKIPVVMENEDDVVVSASSFGSSNVIPVFLTSSVTGENINLLTKFLNLIPKPAATEDEHIFEDPEYQVQEIYSVPDVGSVVGGVLLSGQLNIDRTKTKIFYIGPYHGRFVPCMIKSIHRQRCPVRSLKAGQAATCAIELLPESTRKSVDETLSESEQANLPTEEEEEANDSETSESLTLPKMKIRKGQVILSKLPARMTRQTTARATWEFDAEIHVLYHKGILANMAQGTLYFGSVRQPARIVQIYQIFDEKSVNSPTNDTPLSPTKASLELNDGAAKTLKTGQKGRVRLKFMNEPEWIRVGWTVLFREGRMKCVGKVTAVAPVQQ